MPLCSRHSSRRLRRLPALPRDGGVEARPRGAPPSEQLPVLRHRETPALPVRGVRGDAEGGVRPARLRSEQVWCHREANGLRDAFPGPQPQRPEEPPRRRGGLHRAAPLARAFPPGLRAAAGRPGLAEGPRGGARAFPGAGRGAAAAPAAGAARRRPCLAAPGRRRRRQAGQLHRGPEIRGRHARGRAAGRRPQGPREGEAP
mmetsp:Transcript_39828/g.106798  ORF Transcript_39828/g.106798 Transcript_39828/m.106798 type:complete len:202 (-) Transcript_39828:870-1475(-)